MSLNFVICVLCYGDQTHCENLDCVSQLEIGQADYLLTRHRMYVIVEQRRLQD